jgi:hypothetical protein
MKFTPSKVLLTVLTSFVTILLLASCACAQSVSENIALHKTVTFNVTPNYSYSTDPQDDIQLTDGKYSSGENEVQNMRSLWVQKSSVGWVNRNPVVITVDLGSEQPISGASFSTAAASGNVYWPTSIFVATSDDGVNWHVAGNLVQLSRRNGLPPAEGYATYRYVTHDLKTKGRYVAFAVDSTPYVFCDEIEIYRGDNAWLNQPTPGRAVTSLEKFVPAMAVASAAQQRIHDDIGGIHSAINASKISASDKSTFSSRLQKDADAAEQMDALPKDFKAVLPINDIHRDVLAVRGEFLAAQGFKPITLWKQHRYAWLSLLAKPEANQSPSLHFAMLRNQYRSDNLLLTNASGQQQKVTLAVQNPPQNAAENWLQLSAVAWTDTAQGIPVAGALIPVQPQNGIYCLEIPAGMTRKVWVTIDSSKLPAGTSESTLEIKSDSQSFAVPLNLEISQAAMSTPRLSLGMWDYSNANSYAIQDGNRKAAIALMRSHFVNTAWGTRSILPWPTTAEFDAQNNLKTPLDFTDFDRWIALWRGNKNFFVYGTVGSSFAGAKMGTAKFDARVGSWAKALSAHMKELDLQPQQLGICLVDEPGNDTQDAIIAAWANPIKAGAPHLTLFEDPAAARLGENKSQNSIEPIDIICPTLPAYIAGGPALQKYFQQLKAQGKEQWFYQCTGPVRLYDPQLYYRYQAWHAFADGATGQGFWSFSDISKALSSFSEYGTGRVNYAPVFFDGKAVYSSVHWDAVREGIEDYEELAMLQDAINASNNAAWKRNAQQTLDKAVSSVTGIWKSTNYVWTQTSDPHAADEQLQKVFSVLQSAS